MQSAAVSPTIQAPSAWSSQGSLGLAPEERFLALVVFSQVSQIDAAKLTINLSYDELAQLRQEARDALEQARQAQQSSGFWGALGDFLGSDVGAIASAVAAMAAVVATGGAAAAVIGAVAAAASLAAQHAEELGIPPEIAMGIAIAAAAVSLCCGNAGALFKVKDAVKVAACQVQVAATVVGGVALGGSGGARIAAASYAQDAQSARADARFASGQQLLQDASIDDALELFARAMDDKTFALDQVSQGLRNQQNAESIVLLSLAGAA